MINKARGTFHRASTSRGFTRILSGTLLAGVAPAFAHTPNIFEYPIPTASSFPGSITRGPDGNLWFTEFYSTALPPGVAFSSFSENFIGKITPGGVVTVFLVSPYYSNTGGSVILGGLASGPDGNLWFTEGPSDLIGKIDPQSGVISQFRLPGHIDVVGDIVSSGPTAIATGPDGNLWFTEISGNRIGNINPQSGAITEYPVPTPESGPSSITSGPDGNLWFTEFSSGKFGRVTPAGGMTEFTIPTPGNYPVNIASGPDGNVWFAAANGVGKITPAGTITEFPVPQDLQGPFPQSPNGITSGPEGNLWFTVGGIKIDRITPAGVLSEFAIPGASLLTRSGYPVTPNNIASGPDGNLWFADSYTNKIGQVTAAAATITSGYTGNWYDPSESGHGFIIEVLPGNQMLAEWFVYAPNGGQVWIVATGPITGNTAVLQGFYPVGSGGRFPPNFDPSQLQNQPWGAITFTFTDCANGQVSWQPTVTGYTSGSIPITRLTLPEGLSCLY